MTSPLPRQRPHRHVSKTPRSPRWAAPLLALLVRERTAERHERHRDGADGTARVCRQREERSEAWRWVGRFRLVYAEDRLVAVSRQHGQVLAYLGAVTRLRATPLSRRFA